MKTEAENLLNNGNGFTEYLQFKDWYTKDCINLATHRHMQNSKSTDRNNSYRKIRFKITKLLILFQLEKAF